MSTDPDDRAIVLVIVSLARALGYLTIAEGMEEQQAFLRDNGCGEMQGYLYSRPRHPRNWTSDGRPSARPTAAA